MKKLLLLCFAPLLIGGQAAPLVLAGEPPIASNGDVDSALQPAWGTGAIPGQDTVVGAFRFICSAGQVLPDDPIVYPGQPGKSHLHQFYGNEAADANSTYSRLRTTGTSTCNRGVAVPSNRSAYWMPAMLDANGNVVKPVTVVIYYKRRPASDPKCSLTSGDPKAEGNCVAIPNGLRFIFGYDMISGRPASGSTFFICIANPSVHYDTLAAVNCASGDKVAAEITAPMCWDGKNLDSPNHRDHVSYAGYGDWGYLRCPRTHPYVIPEFKLSAWYPFTPGMKLSCDGMLAGQPAGTCFHADYWEAWDDQVKAMWTANCIDKLLNCSGGDLGNGKQLKGAAI